MRRKKKIEKYKEISAKEMEKSLPPNTNIEKLRTQYKKIPIAERQYIPYNYYVRCTIIKILKNRRDARRRFHEGVSEGC